jgi:hypothetical protein
MPAPPNNRLQRTAYAGRTALPPARSMDSVVPLLWLSGREARAGSPLDGPGRHDDVLPPLRERALQPPPHHHRRRHHPVVMQARAALVAVMPRRLRLLLRKRAGDWAEGLAQDAAIGRRSSISL